MSSPQAAAQRQNDDSTNNFRTIQRDGKTLTWCVSCQTHQPKHLCEWKLLIGILLGSGIVGGVGTIFWIAAAR